MMMISFSREQNMSSCWSRCLVYIAIVVPGLVQANAYWDEYRKIPNSIIFWQRYPESQPEEHYYCGPPHEDKDVYLTACVSDTYFFPARRARCKYCSHNVDIQCAADKKWYPMYQRFEAQCEPTTSQVTCNAQEISHDLKCHYKRSDSEVAAGTRVRCDCKANCRQAMLECKSSGPYSGHFYFHDDVDVCNDNSHPITDGILDVRVVQNIYTYSCSSQDYRLVGGSTLVFCNNGILQNTVPWCEKIPETATASSTTRSQTETTARRRNKASQLTPRTQEITTSRPTTPVPLIPRLSRERISKFESTPTTTSNNASMTISDENSILSYSYELTLLAVVVILLILVVVLSVYVWRLRHSSTKQRPGGVQGGLEMRRARNVVPDDAEYDYPAFNFQPQNDVDNDRQYDYITNDFIKKPSPAS